MRSGRGSAVAAGARDLGCFLASKFLGTFAMTTEDRSPSRVSHPRRPHPGTRSRPSRHPRLSAKTPCRTPPAAPGLFASRPSASKPPLEQSTHTRPAPWLRWARSSSTWSTGCRISFSTPSEMIPWTCPRLYVTPLAQACMAQQLAAQRLRLPSVWCHPY
jgi:hypothetical protein